MKAKTPQASPMPSPRKSFLSNQSPGALSAQEPDVSEAGGSSRRQTLLLEDGGGVRRRSLLKNRASTFGGSHENSVSAEVMATKSLRRRRSGAALGLNISDSTSSRFAPETIGLSSTMRSSARKDWRQTLRRIKLWPAEIQRFFMRSLRALIESYVFSILMNLLTFYVLFGDDVRLAFFSKKDDAVFDAITASAFCCSIFELVAQSLVLPDYWLSFFLFFDVAAALSLVIDLTPVWASLESQNSDAVDAANVEYARAERASRVGTRAVRVLRIVRLVWVHRIMRVFGRSTVVFRSTLRGGKHTISHSASIVESENEEPPSSLSAVERESRLGKKLSARTTLWLLLIVLAMLFVVPQLAPEDEDAMMETSAQYGAEVVQQAWSQHLLAPSDTVYREEFERHFLFYIYYHNSFSTCPSYDRFRSVCVGENLYGLAYVGIHSKGVLDSTLNPVLNNASVGTWDTLFVDTPDPAQMGLIVGNIPDVIKQRLTNPWANSCQSDVWGVSLSTDDPCPGFDSGTIRSYEAKHYSPSINWASVGDGESLVFVFDGHLYTRQDAVMSIFFCVFILCLLIFAALMFTRDADKLVLRPIERMIAKVELIQRDPLQAISTAGLEPFGEEECKRSWWSTCLAIFGCGSRDERSSGEGLNHCDSRLMKKRLKQWSKSQSASQSRSDALETKMLENTILKLGSLLAIGFGEAGGEIIGHNLGANEEIVDATLVGRFVEAIYGYCRIQDFAFTTVCLQQKTMVFVNQVAQILHRIVDEYQGSPNRNFGEAFLLVWRFKDSDVKKNVRIADLSVMSFVHVASAVHRDAGLAVYRSHPALLGRGRQYRVNVHFGLHLGRSIEGAIGSEFKIDASYVSSHVTMAMQLEALTKGYGVIVLMSEDVARAGTEALASNYRVIDNVKVEGMRSNLRLFTVDLDVTALDVAESKDDEDDEDLHPLSRTSPELAHYHYRMRRQIRRERKLSANYNPALKFCADRHIQKMRQAYPKTFFQEFEKGYLNYEAGEWDVAADVFRATASMIGGRSDGPSLELLKFMDSHGCDPPATWQGFREVSATFSHDDEPRAEGGRGGRPRVAGGSGQSPIVLLGGVGPEPKSSSSSKGRVLSPYDEEASAIAQPTY